MLKIYFKLISNFIILNSKPTDWLKKNASINQISNINPLPYNKILDWSKLKQTADNILKFIYIEK